MGFLIKNMVASQYGAQAGDCVSRFADCYAGNNVMGFVNRFRAIAMAAQPKFTWAQSDLLQKCIKANVVAVLGLQFKPPHAHMPQSAALTTLLSLDGFVVAGVSSSKVETFLSYWEHFTNQSSAITDADCVIFLNTIRNLRQSLEDYIAAHPEQAGLSACKKLQSHLCYLEAGLYAVTSVKKTDSGYEVGPREAPEPVNFISQGFLDYEQPAAGKNETALQNKLRELQHDILVSGVFAQEAALFDTLDCHPLLDCYRPPCTSVQALVSAKALTQAQAEQPACAEAITSAFARLRTLSPDLVHATDDVLVRPRDLQASDASLHRGSGLDDRSAALFEDATQSEIHAQGVSMVAGMMRHVYGRCLGFLDQLHEAVLGRNMQSHAVKVMPAADAHAQDDDVLDSIASGIGRLQSQVNVSRQVASPDHRRMLKSRLRHYLSQESAYLDQHETLSMDDLLQLHAINLQAGATLDAIFKTTRSPFVNQVKSSLGMASEKASVRQFFYRICDKYHAVQKAMIVKLFEAKLPESLYDKSTALDWLQHHYGLSRCDDSEALLACLQHLQKAPDGLSLAKLQSYCALHALPLSSPRPRHS